MTIGERIKILRKERGMTQEQLAKKCGYKSLTTINKIELGINRITLSVVEVLAEALGVTPAYLMGWEENTNNGINNGIIGNNNNNNIINGVELDEIEAELLTLCSQMTVTQKARLLTYANDLLDK